MSKQITGLEDASCITNGRHFRQTAAADVQRWVATLPPSATQELVSRVEWIGEAWDGAEDVTIGDLHGRSTELVTGAEIQVLLGKLRHGIPAAVSGSYTLPDRTSVRSCIAPSGKIGLTFDIDLVDFVLPVYIDFRGGFGSEKAPTIVEIADRMLLLISAADAARETIARREAALTEEVEAVAARIGDGAAPLWLRMEPIAFYENRKHVRRREYVMLLVTLNAHLVWAPTGSERIYTATDVRRYHGHLAAKHRERAAMLRRMAVNRTSGYVSEVAIAFMRERGLDPTETFRQARDLARSDFRGQLEFERSGRKEALYFREGILSVSLALDGGHFQGDSLMLWGDLPASKARGLRGSRLDALVSHPVLAMSGLTADRVQVRPGAVDLSVTEALMSLEEAQRIHDLDVPMAQAA